MYGDGHGLAYLLDPRYIGARLSETLRDELENYLFSFPVHGVPLTEDQVLVIVAEYGKYKSYINDMKTKPTFKVLLNKTLPIIDWVKGLGENMFPFLKIVLLRIISLIAISASAERNFSTMAFIHTKKRNRLSPDRVEKLVFIYVNGHQNDSCPCEIDYITSDSEAEVHVLDMVESSDDE
jgi:hypothetical protein